MNNNIEETMKTIEKMIKSYKEADKCGLSNNDFKNEIKALEYILLDYKKLQEEFKQLDKECGRLEEKEIGLEKENEKLKRFEKAYENGEYTWKQKYEETFEYVKNSISKSKIEEKIEAYRRAISDSNDGDLIHDLRSEIHILEELLENDKK